jgi:hypothetical protein
MARYRNWEEALDDSIQFLRIEGSHVFCMKDGFIFKVSRKNWPPKRLSPDLAIDPTEYYRWQVQEVHKQLYDLSKTFYKNSNATVTATCSIHGDFELQAKNLRKGRGCQSCGYSSGYNKLAETRKLMVSDSATFITKAIGVHGERYDYSKVNYTRSAERVSILCKLHGNFEQQANNHLSGQGCPECGVEANRQRAIERGSTGFTRTYFINASNGFATLYLIKCSNESEVFYKIGITSKTVEHRFRSKNLPYDYSVEHEYVAEAGLIWDLETTMHREYKSVKYIPEKEFGGMYECFSHIDVGEYEKLLTTIA